MCACPSMRSRSPGSRSCSPPSAGAAYGYALIDRSACRSEGTFDLAEAPCTRRFTARIGRAARHEWTVQLATRRMSTCQARPQPSLRRNGAVETVLDTMRRRGVIEGYLLDRARNLRSTECPVAPRNAGPHRVARSSHRACRDEGEHRSVSPASARRSKSPSKFALAGAARPCLFRVEAVVFLVALALFVLPLYAIPENTLPPAPWDRAPGISDVKLYVSLGAFVLAVPGGADRGRRRVAATRFIALASLSLAGTSLAVSAAVGAIGAVSGPIRARKRYDTRLDPGRDRVPRGRRCRVASIGRAWSFASPRDLPG